jgi:hypothetical protein
MSVDSFLMSSLLTDFVCLYNYEFGLSLCKIVRSSVILLLPLLFHIIPVGFYLDSVCNNAVLLWNRYLQSHDLNKQYGAASPHSVLSKYR